MTRKNNVKSQRAKAAWLKQREAKILAKAAAKKQRRSGEETRAGKKRKREEGEMDVDATEKPVRKSRFRRKRERMLALAAKQSGRKLMEE